MLSSRSQLCWLHQVALLSCYPLPAVMLYSTPSLNINPPQNKIGYAHTTTTRASHNHSDPQINSSITRIYEKLPAHVNKKKMIFSHMLKFRQMEYWQLNSSLLLDPIEVHLHLQLHSALRIKWILYKIPKIINKLLTFSSSNIFSLMSHCACLQQ